MTVEPVTEPTPETKPEETPVTEPTDVTEDAAGEEQHGNRNEKKMKKAMQKMGLKPFPDVLSVTVKRGKSRFTIHHADCYKSPTSETYVVFGEIKIDDMTQAAQQQAAEKVTAPEKVPETIPEAPEDEGETPDDTGIDQKDIELIMQNSNCSRAKAIKALRDNNMDIVSAIMSLENK